MTKFVLIKEYELGCKEHYNKKVRTNVPLCNCDSSNYKWMSMFDEFYALNTNQISRVLFYSPNIDEPSFCLNTKIHCDIYEVKEDVNSNIKNDIDTDIIINIENLVYYLNS